MRRKIHVSLLAIAGLLIVLASAMPAIVHHAGPRDDLDGDADLLPRAAVYPDYLYTIGISGVSGSDNDHLYQPFGIAVNATGHVYVADTWNNRVQVFNKAGIYQYTICGNGMGGGNNQFNNPDKVAINSTGHVYVADPYNFRVQVFDKAGIYQYTIGTTEGSGNYQFEFPRGVAVNATGHLYVADGGNNRVQVFDKAGIYQYTIGTGTGGTGDYQLNTPQAVAVNATGHVYVEDPGQERVQVFDKAGIYQYTICGNGQGSGNNQFHNLRGVVVNATGFIYAADSSNARVQVFNNAGNYLYTIYGNDPFNGPGEVAVNATGHVYVVDIFNHRVVVFGNHAPASLSIVIDAGAAETSSTSVALTLSATGATEMCFSNDGTTYSAWEVYGTTKMWELLGGLGLKTVYFKARNDLTEADPVSDSITYALPDDGPDGIPGFPVEVFLLVSWFGVFFLWRRYRMTSRA